MATVSSLSAPGVEVREYDNSLRPITNAGTTVFVPGYAAQGPVEEVIQISSIMDFENVYGIPTTDAERYFYYTCLAILNNSGQGTTLLTSRLPYGANAGDNVANAYTLLAYPVIPVGKNSESLKNYNYYSAKNTSTLAGHFIINKVKPSVNLNEVVINSNFEKTTEKFTIVSVSPTGKIPALKATKSDIGECKPELTWKYDGLQETSKLDIYSEYNPSRNSIILYIASQLTSDDKIIGYLNIELEYTDTKENSEFIDYFQKQTASLDAHFTSSLTTALGDTQLIYQASHEKRSILNDELNKNNTEKDVTYIIGAPATFNVSLTEYYQILAGEYFQWSNNVNDFNTDFGSDMKDTLSKAAFITINTSRSILNDSYEGLYFGITDNLFNEPSSQYTLKSIKNVKFTNWNRDPNSEDENVVGIVDTKDKNENKFTTINKNRLDFYLESSNKSSISSVIQTSTTTFDTSSKDYDDTVNFAVYKLAKSSVGTEAMKLTYEVKEKYNASLGKTRVYSVATAVTPQNYFVESIVEGSKNLTVMVNPYISNKIKIDANGNLCGKVRFLSSKLIDIYETFEKEYLSAPVSSLIANDEDLSKIIKISKNNITNWSNLCERVGVDISTLKSIASDATNYKLFNLNDSLYPFATYTVAKKDNKYIGSTPIKITRALELISNDEEYPDIDIIVEGGLGTIYAYTNNAHNLISEGSSSLIGKVNCECGDNKHTFNADAILQGVEDLRTARSSLTEDADKVVQDYISVQEAFQSLANSFQNGGRGDTFYIADVLRGILIRGANTKVEKLFGTKLTNNVYSDSESVNHSWATSIYNPIKHLIEQFTTSYASIYAQWVKIHDGYTNEKFWVPVSGYMAALMCAADQLQGPWYAGAGLNRGIVEGVIDAAINPNQKQRGDLYKICVNSVPKLANIGITNWGIRTLSKKASAFDQNTCRRTFLFIEKAIKKLLRYYLFEPNNSYTQLSIYNEIEPYMESIRNQGGIYSFTVVVDKTNNTPEIVNAGNLAVDVSAAPTRTAEFIVLNMTANKYTQEVATSELNG